MKSYRDLLCILLFCFTMIAFAKRQARAEDVADAAENIAENARPSEIAILSTGRIFEEYDVFIASLRKWLS